MQGSICFATLVLISQRIMRGNNSYIIVIIVSTRALRLVRYNMSHVTIISSIDPGSICKNDSVDLLGKSTSFRLLAYIFFMAWSSRFTNCESFSKIFYGNLLDYSWVPPFFSCYVYILLVYLPVDVEHNVISRYWFPGSINIPSDLSEFTRSRRSLPYFSETCTFFLYVDTVSS